MIPERTIADVGNQAVEATVYWQGYSALCREVYVHGNTREIKIVIGGIAQTINQRYTGEFTAQIDGTPRRVSLVEKFGIGHEGGVIPLGIAVIDCEDSDVYDGHNYKELWVFPSTLAQGQNSPEISRGIIGIAKGLSKI